MVLDDLGGDVFAMAIPAEKAALLLTLDHGYDLNEEPFTDDETRPYEQEGKFKDSSGREHSVWRGIYEMLAIEPTGQMRQTRDRLLELVLQSIERGQLKADRIRRNLDGTLDASETLIDLGALTEWAEVHGMEPSDLMESVKAKEYDLLGRMRTLALEWEDNKELDAARIEKQAQLQQYPEHVREEMLRLIVENQRLRTEARVPQERPMSKREHESLLKLIAAMAHDCYRDRITKPYSVAKDIEAAADQLGLALSDDTIAAKLKEAVALIPKRPA